MDSSVERRQFVDMDALWTMPIEVPVSLLLRDRNYAWTCGQLALDAEGNVLHPDDLLGQTERVCDYITEILRRADLPTGAIRRALLYYVHRSDAERDAMVELFTSRLGSDVLLDPIPLPHFYYDGVLLEVDVFCGIAEGKAVDHGAVTTRSSGDVTWVRFEAPVGDLVPALDQLDDVLAELDSVCLSEHWFVPSNAAAELGSILSERGWSSGGFVVDAGPVVDTVSGVLVFVRADSGRSARSHQPSGDVAVTVRTAGEFAWLHGISTNPDHDLVQQTRQIMTVFGERLKRLGVDFVDVAKCTTHYVGGASADDLHGNLTVRNGYYTKPGLASTGLPVFGFSNPATHISVDLTIYSPLLASSKLTVTPPR